MTKIQSVSELKEMRDKYRAILYPERSDESMILIKVGMSTCGIASGARDVMKALEEECENQAVDARIKQTGCLGLCYAEPMVEVQLPGQKPRIFGFVDKARAKDIVGKYILRGEKAEGEITTAFITSNE